MQKGLKEKIKQRDFKLQSLLDITKAINADVPTTELLELYKEILVQQLQIGKVLLVSIEEQKEITLISTGFTNDSIWFPYIQERAQKKTAKIDTIEVQGTQVVIVPIEKDGQPLAFVVLGDNDEEKVSISPSIKHMRFVQTITGVLIVAIQNKKLIAESISQAAIQRELQLASEMQSMLLPKKLPQNDSLKVDAFYKSHGQVGGDYYDFIQINAEEWICCMADVSGKGVSAAFIMAGFQAHLRSLIEHFGCDLKKIICSLNNKVLESAQGEKFVTFFIGHYNKNTRIFNYVNCGHNPPFVFHTDKNSWLAAFLPGLGIIDTFQKFESRNIVINPGDQILLYTDGLVEVENEIGTPFGENGIEEYFSDHDDVLSNEKLINYVSRFIGKMKFIDDIALLHISIK